jgi:hypothetical protein
LFVGAWAVDAYVDKDSPLALVLLAAGLIAALVLFASTGLADRIFWRRVADKLRPHLATASALSPPTDDRRQARIAANRVEAELRDIGLRLRDRIDQGPGWWWRDKHLLPTSEWDRMRDEIAGNPDLSQAWGMVSHAYAQIDAVNRYQTQRVRQEDEYESVGGIMEDDETEEDPEGGSGFNDLNEARAAVGRAERDLSNALRNL